MMITASVPKLLQVFKLRHVELWASGSAKRHPRSGGTCGGILTKKETFYSLAEQLGLRSRYVYCHSGS